MATRKRTATTEPTVEQPVEEVVVEAPVVKESKLCACGCNLPTAGGSWRPGHDAQHKSRLLKAYDAGDQAAGEELVSRTWQTVESLAARGAKGDRSDAAKAERLLAKADRLSEQIDALNARRDGLLAERRALLDGEPAPVEPAAPVEDAS